MKSIYLPSMTAHGSTNSTSEYNGDYSALGTEYSIVRQISKKSN
jgi:hypothetical protein